MNRIVFAPDRSMRLFKLIEDEESGHNTKVEYLNVRTEKNETYEIREIVVYLLKSFNSLHFNKVLYTPDHKIALGVPKLDVFGRYMIEIKNGKKKTEIPLSTYIDLLLDLPEYAEAS